MLFQESDEYFMSTASGVVENVDVHMGEGSGLGGHMWTEDMVKNLFILWTL